jgi:hypothetical protein
MLRVCGAAETTTGNASNRSAVQLFIAVLLIKCISKRNVYEEALFYRKTVGEVGNPSRKHGIHDGSFIVLYSIVLNTQLSKYYIVSDIVLNIRYIEIFFKYNLHLQVSCTCCAVYPCMRCSVRA